VKSLVTWLDPQPPSEALPRLMPSPFDDTPPHPVATALALELQATLRAGEIAPGLSTALLHRPEGGKMFGVLVVRARPSRASSVAGGRSTGTSRRSSTAKLAGASSRPPTWR